MLSRIGLIALGMFLAVALAVGFVTAQPGATLEPTDRVAVGLNVRAEARSDAQIVAVLRPGDRVTQIGAVPFWYNVRLGDGTEGYADLLQ